MTTSCHGPSEKKNCQDARMIKVYSTQTLIPTGFLQAKATLIKLMGLITWDKFPFICPTYEMKGYYAKCMNT